jgi:NAD-dependent dihydropyrimidine dehydrogenase PreA subunit
MKDFKVKVADCDAETCGRRCQKVCPQGVFLAVPREKDHAKHGAHPRYRIVPRFAYFCEGCGKCLTACGQNAIHITSRKTREEIVVPAART